MSKVRLPNLPEPDPLPTVEFMPLGFPALDEALGGGLPLGKMIHVYGKRDSGKTTLAIYAMIKFQRTYPDRRVHYIDTERHFSTERAERMGLDISKERFEYYSRSNVSALANTLTRLVEGTDDLIVVDTIANADLGENLDGSTFELDKKGNFANNPRVAGQANILTRTVKKISADQADAKISATVWINNQLRANIGTYGGPETVTPGGYALHFNTTVDLSLRSPKQLLENGKMIGLDMPITVARSKYGYKIALEEGQFPRVFFTDSVERAEHDALFSLAVNAGAIIQTGGWFTVVDPREPEKVLLKVHGRAKLEEKLNEDMELRQRVQAVVDRGPDQPSGSSES